MYRAGEVSVTTRSQRMVAECILTRSILIKIYYHFIVCTCTIVFTVRQFHSDVLIIIIIIALFQEDNIFSTNASLRYVLDYKGNVLLMLNALVLSAYLEVRARLSISDLRLPSDRRDWEIAPPSYVLGSFQCRDVLLLLHIKGQWSAVLAAGARRVCWFFFFYSFHLSSLSNVLSFGRRLNMAEILWFWLLNPNGSYQLLPRTSSLSTG